VEGYGIDLLSLLCCLSLPSTATYPEDRGSYSAETESILQHKNLMYAQELNPLLSIYFNQIFSLIMQGDFEAGKYKCLICKKEFNSESGVKYHINSVHSQVRNVFVLDF
jgi:hypothetical protein